MFARPASNAITVEGSYPSSDAPLFWNLVRSEKSLDKQALHKDANAWRDADFSISHFSNLHRLLHRDLKPSMLTEWSEARLSNLVARPSEADETELAKAVVISPTRQTERVKINVQTRLIALKEWEGFVTEIDMGDGSFSARLCDLTDGTRETEAQATLYIDDLDPDDHELLKLGGIFRWVIGYRDTKFGTRERVSNIRFRRLPAWSAREIKRAKQAGEELASAFPQP